MDSTAFSSSILTKYTNGYCHLLSWTLKNYFGSRWRAQIVELVEGSKVQHSLIYVSIDSSNNVFLDICGKYCSEEGVLEMWEIISPSEEERTLRYLSPTLSASEKEKWWYDLGQVYTLREQKETEEFVIHHSSFFHNILFGACLTIEDCEKIKEKLWDDDASFEIDVQDVIKKILSGQSTAYLSLLQTNF